MPLLSTPLLIVLMLWGAPDRPADPSALAAVRAEARIRIELINKLAPSVVALYSEGDAGGGSGVLITPEGLGLTNFHVVASSLRDRTFEAGLPPPPGSPPTQVAPRYKAEILGLDPYGDVAVFRLIGDGPFPAATLGDCANLHVGDPTLAMGNPFLLAENNLPTVTFGIISGLHRYQKGSRRALQYTDCIQVDASINPGNSGGPLFDMSGRLIGINGRVSIEERGRVNVGVGYAITIDQIKRFLPGLRAGLAVKHASTGFTVGDVGGKVFVNQIERDSVAWRAGLRLEDRITRFAGHEIRSANQFASLLGTLPAGWPIELAFQRGEKTTQLRLRTGNLPLPDVQKGPLPPGVEPFNPFAPHPITDAANRREARRALARVRKYMRGETNADVETILAKMYIHCKGRRVRANPICEEAVSLDVVERRPDPSAEIKTFDDRERLHRWNLIVAADETEKHPDRILGSDEVHGRIALVLEHRSNVGPVSYFVDDEDGRLLGIEFRDEKTNAVVRCEYDDDRRCGPLRLPHRRTLYVNDILQATDDFSVIEVGQ